MWPRRRRCSPQDMSQCTWKLEFVETFLGVFDLSLFLASGTDHVVDCSFVIYVYAHIFIFIYNRFIVYTYAHDPVISSLSNRLTKVEELILTEEKKRSKKRCKMLSFSKVFREKSKNDIFHHQHFASFSPAEDGPCPPGLEEKNDILTFDFYF